MRNTFLLGHNRQRVATLIEIVAVHCSLVTLFKLNFVHVSIMKRMVSRVGLQHTGVCYAYESAREIAAGDVILFNQTSVTTPPGHPFVNRHNEYMAMVTASC